MRAWQVVQHGEPTRALRLVDSALPEPGPTEVRVRVAAAALALPDVLMCQGTYPLTPALPFTGKNDARDCTAEGPDGLADLVLHFDIREVATGRLTKFDDLLGLVPHTGCPPDSDIYRLGEIAQEQKIWIYVAVPHRALDSSGLGVWAEKLKVLNRYFSERLGTPNKKILILPDYFGLQEQFDHGMIMADIGLTTMEG